MIANHLLDTVFDRAELERIGRYAVSRTCVKGESVFSEGQPADQVYFIEHGQVSIFTKPFTQQEDIAIVGAGECFGEMAMASPHRTASAAALSDTSLLCIATDRFARLLREDEGISTKIERIITRRGLEIYEREDLYDGATIHGRKLRISIKGDPSLRETAFSRDRYESVVDPLLPRLQPSLESLLIERCIYKLVIHFNSGEVHTHSVLDPFNAHIHPATRLTDPAYLDRHFATMSYRHKCELIGRVYKTTMEVSAFETLSDRFRRACIEHHRRWEPMPEAEVRTAISRLTVLRSMPNFYIRNFEIAMTREALRMQFNCDGTHIVHAGDYLNFLQEYVA